MKKHDKDMDLLEFTLIFYYRNNQESILKYFLGFFTAVLKQFFTMCTLHISSEFNIASFNSVILLSQYNSTCNILSTLDRKVDKLPSTLLIYFESSESAWLNFQYLISFSFLNPVVYLFLYFIT